MNEFITRSGELAYLIDEQPFKATLLEDFLECLMNASKRANFDWTKGTVTFSQRTDLKNKPYQFLFEVHEIEK